MQTPSKTRKIEAQHCPTSKCVLCNRGKVSAAILSVNSNTLSSLYTCEKCFIDSSALTSTLEGWEICLPSLNSRIILFLDYSNYKKLFSSLVFNVMKRPFLNLKNEKDIGSPFKVMFPNFDLSCYNLFETVKKNAEISDLDSLKVFCSSLCSSTDQEFQGKKFKFLFKYTPISIHSSRSCPKIQTPTILETNHNPNLEICFFCKEDLFSPAISFIEKENTETIFERSLCENCALKSDFVEDEEMIENSFSFNKGIVIFDTHELQLDEMEKKFKETKMTKIFLNFISNLKKNFLKKNLPRRIYFRETFFCLNDVENFIEIDEENLKKISESKDFFEMPEFSRFFCKEKFGFF